MKNFIIGALGIIVMAIVVFQEQVADAFYMLTYRPSHAAQIVQLQNKEIEKQFDNANPSGWYHYSEEVKLSYASFFNKEEGKYYYRFRNLGKHNLCFKARSLTSLFGNIVVEISPNTSKYFVINSNNLPIKTTHTFKGYPDCSYFSRFGGSFEIVVPGVISGKN